MNFVVPGYNNSVIVRHGIAWQCNSNLSTVYVKKGDTVTTRHLLERYSQIRKDGNAPSCILSSVKKRKLNPRPAGLRVSASRAE